MLLTDTNILQRVSRGRAMKHVVALRRRGIRLMTTEHNVAELYRNLTNTLGFDDAGAASEVERVLAPFEIVLADEYSDRRSDAQTRLRNGGKSDWPALAAALALDGEIWSEDVDYFGVGVPVWNTPNIHYVETKDV